MRQLTQGQQQREYPQSQIVIPSQPNQHLLQQQNQVPAFNTNIPQLQATNPQRYQTTHPIRLVENSGQPSQALAIQQVSNQQQQQLRNTQVQSAIYTNQGLDKNQGRPQPKLIQNGLSSLQPYSPNQPGQPTTSNNNGFSQSMIVIPQQLSGSQQQNISRANPRLMSKPSDGNRITTITPDNKVITLVLNDKSGRASSEIINPRPPPTNQQTYLPQGFNHYEQQIRQSMQINTIPTKSVQASGMPQADTFDSSTKSFNRCICCQQGIFEKQDKCILRCQCKFHKSCLANFLNDVVFKQKGSQLRCRCRNKIFLKDIKSVVLPNVIQQLLNNQLSIATTVLQLTKCSSLSGCPYLYKHIKGEVGKCQTCYKTIT